MFCCSLLLARHTVRKLKKELQAHKESSTKREHHPDQTMRVNELKRLNSVLNEQINALTGANTDLLDQNKKLCESKGGHKKLEQEITTLKKENA